MSQTVRIDFYLLENNTSFWQAACRLLEKAYYNQLNTFVWCNTAEDAEHLDHLLWTFKEESFIPHLLNTEQNGMRAPIEIGTTQLKKDTTLILNLTSQIPEIYPTLQRILEIVPNDEASKTVSREHYRQYRSLEFTLNTHHI